MYLLGYPICLTGSILMTIFVSGALSICPAESHTQATVFDERCVGLILPTVIVT